MQPVATRCWQTASPEETHALGFRCGQLAHAGDFIACCGTLGAGKTTFVQGFAEGLGVGDEHYVRSPTFTLMQEYRGRLPLYHFDFYRLTDVVEVQNIGFEDYLDGAGVVLVEWADKFPSLLPLARLHIVIDIPQPEQRDVWCAAFGDSYTRYVYPALSQ